MEARPAWPRAEVSYIAGARALTCALSGLLAALAVLLVSRRLAGGLVDPLPGGTLLLAGALAASLAAATRVMGRLAGLDRLAPVALSLRWGPLLALILWTAALIVPGTSPAALSALGVLLLSEELWSTGLLTTLRTLRPAPGIGCDKYDATAQPASTSSAWAAHAPLAPHDEIAEHEEHVLLRMTRARADSGQEVLHGVLRVEFAARQRAESAHLAFCPPFAQTPTLEALALDGPAAQIRVSQLLPYGCRLDVRLNQPHTEAVELLIQFTAHAPPL